MNIANQIYSWFSNNDTNIKNLANNEILQIANEMNGLFSEVNDNKHKISLPRIVVVGTQSSGKSTVLNAIMSLDILPTGKNMVTRTPLDIRLHNIKNEDAQQSARIEMGYYREGGWYCERNIKLSIPNASREEIENIRGYISKRTNEIAGEQMNISKDPIYLQVYSPNVPDLSLVDLPGLIMMACTDKGQPKDIPEQIEKLIEFYVKKPNTITLSIIQSRSDLETDLGLALIKKYNCSKTIGVLTKPDLMNNDSHVGNYLCGNNNISQDLMLDYGYFVVKNSSHMEYGEYDIARIMEMEKKYFSSHWEYNKSFYQNRIGYNSLIKELSKILINAIREAIPNAFQKLAEIENDIMQKQTILGKNPPSTKESQLVEINLYINNLNKTFNESIESKLTLYNTGKDIKKIFDQYRISIEQIRPFAKNDNTIFTDNYFSDMVMGFEGYHLSSHVSPIILLEKCITDNKNQPINTLRKPCLDCMESISNVLILGLQKILGLQEFSKYPQLVNLIINKIIENIIVPYKKKAEHQIDLYLQNEIDYIWTDDNQFIDLLNKVAIVNKNEINNLRNLISSYFEVIKKDVKNYVPKLIMSMIIRNVQKNMIDNLMSHIVQDNLTEILKEDPQIEEERKYCDSVLQKIQIIKKIVNQKINM